MSVTLDKRESAIVSSIKSRGIKSNPKAFDRVRASKRISRILDEVCEDPYKFVRIVRSHISQEKKSLFTFSQINYRVERGDTHAKRVLEEYVRQEREDGVPSFITDEQILSLWAHKYEGKPSPVCLGRIAAADSYQIYRAIKKGSTPFFNLNHLARALNSVGQGSENESFEVEGWLTSMATEYHFDYLDQDKIMSKAFEEVSPGFHDIYLRDTVEVDDDDGEEW